MGGELEIIVKTTDACNARCLYCSAGSDPAGGRKLSIETARMLCDQAAELLEEGRFERVRFLWHGGEPLLLGKSFFRELSSFARPGVFGHNVQTNLTLIDAEWIEILEPLIGRNGTGTSVDPFDDVRRLGDRDGYTRRWLKGIELLDRADWCVGCVYVLHRRGLGRAKDVYWFFRNVRDNSRLSLRVNPLLQVGRAQGADCEGLSLTPGEYGTFLIDLAGHWLADRRRLILSPLKDIVAAWEGRGHVRSCDLAGPAGCTESHLGVDPDGEVYNCGRAVDASGMRFGRLGEVSLADCLDHPLRQVLREREGALREGRCGNCPDWRLCHGGCPYESHTTSERANEPTLLCEDYKRLFQWLGETLGPRREGRKGKTGSAPTESRTGGPTQETECPLFFRAGPDGGVAGVQAATGERKVVLIDRPRDWDQGALKTLAEFFLHSPTLEVPIEPFYSALMYFTPDGEARSLRSIYGESASKDRPAACLTCQAFKCCRGFWLDPVVDRPHCDEWRSIVGLLAEAAGVARRAHGA